MKSRTIVISQPDLQRLNRLLASGFARAIRPSDYLDDLRDELQRASVVPADSIPEHTVTMKSTVVLRDLDTKELETYTLVYPERANIVEGRLSILAPVGTAVLGHAVGDVVQWRIPGGIRRSRIEQVLSPAEHIGADRW